ncbi:MAG: tRNA (adenosine(37)-N6)-dimethylallyltransferase MiaA [Alphaproteobacteria bacterium]|nr:tRNA (adenosine(37)-N6)-dimethylallyltransferase MiaA [Alphaproteobacteria bacterium]
MDGLILAGPTASGKTALAVVLARLCDGVVINADSMQVYADLQRLSARPTTAEMQGVPHYLFGHVDGSGRYSVGRWLQDVRSILPEVAGKLPIFCGGTGMYIKALSTGFTDIPEIPTSVKAQVADEYQALGHGAFTSALVQRTPQALAHVVQAPDRQRLLRAAEVMYATGKPLSEWHQHMSAPILKQPHHLVLLPDRVALYARINRRCTAMMTTARAEVVALLARNLSTGLPIMRCLGVEVLGAVQQGRVQESVALRDFARKTQHYAKRQFTWLRHQIQADPVEDDFGDTLPDITLPDLIR